MNKQPFTIGGSVALKKALLEEAGLTSCSSDTVKHGYLIIETDTIKMAGRAFAKKDVHYHLPEEYNEALQAVKDFFLEEPKPGTLVLRDVKMGDVIGITLLDIELTSQHLQQLKAALAL
jgi:hypothetical protein